MCKGEAEEGNEAHAPVLFKPHMHATGAKSKNKTKRKLETEEYPPTSTPVLEWECPVEIYRIYEETERRKAFFLPEVG